MSTSYWFLLQSGPGASAWNMALDEALLETMPRLNQPVLRFYGWVEPAATFGYFQEYPQIAALTPLRPLIRRPTGGGLVPHDRDWTYSIIVPPGHDWYALTASTSYRRVHDWLRLGFARFNVTTELAAAASKEQPGQCFVGHEQSDLLWQTRKIAGAAQRRRRDGLLIQGSVQPPSPAPPREKWEEAVCVAGTEQFGISWSKLNLTPALQQRAEELAATKYSTSAHNQRR